jgi:uncharacterized damage-inducible protein DinB
MNNNPLLTSLLRYHAWAHEELFGTLHGLDAQQHAAELHAALRILNHIYVVQRIFLAHLQDVEHPYTATNTTATPTLEALHEAMQDADRAYLEHAATLSADQLNERLLFTFVDGDHGCMSRAEILAHIVTHGGYHRGAVGRILAQLEQAPPRDIYTRFVHQEQPQRREAGND